MKKNGFIATSLIYSFFLVFIGVITALVGSYLVNKNLLKKFNSDIIEEMNAHYEDIFVTNGAGTIVGLTDYGKTLSSITIPKSVGTEEITGIVASYYDPSTYSNINFCEGSKVETLNFGHLTSINSDAAESFSGCTNLKRVVGNNVSSLYGPVFMGCENLTDVMMPNLTSISGTSTFSNCSNLKNIDLSNVTYIGDHAFWYCTSLESIDLSSIEDLNYDQPFQYCDSLTHITLNKSFAPSGLGGVWVVDPGYWRDDFDSYQVFGVSSSVAPLGTTIVNASDTIKNLTWSTQGRNVTFID